MLWGIGLILLIGSFTVLTALIGQNQGLERAAVIRGFFRELGFSALPASSPSAGSQSSLEGISSCLKDTPGGYCYQTENPGAQPVPFIKSDYYRLEVW